MTDLIFLELLAGDGGNGRVSFRREKRVAKGGPDGGDGGDGGNVVVRASNSYATLKHLAGKTQLSADKGQDGSKRKKTGAKGEDLVIEVPVGTKIWQLTENMAAHHRRLRFGGVDQRSKRGDISKKTYTLEKEGEFIPSRDPDELMETETSPKELKQLSVTTLEEQASALGLVPLIELTEDGQEAVICQGGVGGRGNTAFKGPARTTPLIAEYGSFGERRQVMFELQLLADVGLVGFPNAGKSTLISRLTSARPKIASYPFTTLEPHLGVYTNTRSNQELVIADIPGLIEGASQGKGLGYQFLRHITNCQALLYVLAVDEMVLQNDQLAAEDMAETVWQQYQALHTELKEYSDILESKTARVFVNKADIYSDELKDALNDKFSDHDVKVTLISAATGEGIDQLDQYLAGLAS